MSYTDRTVKQKQFENHSIKLVTTSLYKIHISIVLILGQVNLRAKSEGEAERSISFDRFSEIIRNNVDLSRDLGSRLCLELCRFLLLQSASRIYINKAR